MDAEAIHAEQIGYNPPDFESCYSLAGKQDAHDFAARHAIMLEARDALEPEKIEYMPGANAHGISKATASLIKLTLQSLGVWSNVGRMEAWYDTRRS